MTLNERVSEWQRRGESVEFGGHKFRIPVVPALLAATIAVIGVVASLSIDRGITNALDHPELAGITWDVAVMPAQQATTGRNVSTHLADDISKAKDDGAIL